MIPDRAFLRRCAHQNNLNLPHSVLEDIVCLYCQSYDRGKLDIAIPDPLTRFKERCEDLKDLIMDLRVDVAYLQDLCNHYEQILREHGLL